MWGINMGDQRIANLAPPLESKDGTTKLYVDTSLNAAVAAVKGYVDVSLNAIRHVGDIKMSIKSANHDGWFLCNGQSLSKSRYPALFTLLGNSFGEADGANFKLPNTGGKVLGMVDGTHGLGTSLGAETHTMNTNEMPAHTHTYNDAYFAENHRQDNVGVFGTEANADTDNEFYYRTSDASYSTTPSNLITSSAGSGAAFSVMQPTLFVGYTFIYGG